MTKRRADSYASMFEELTSFPLNGSIVYVQILLEELDIAANAFYNELKDSIPMSNRPGAAHLRDSLKVDRQISGTRISYTFSFDGYNDHGVSYDLIANIWEYGASYKNGRMRTGTHKIRELVSKHFKGIDKRAYERFEREGGMMTATKGNSAEAMSILGL